MCVGLLEQEAREITEVIGAAIEVHKDKGPGLVKGPGLLESTYKWCLTMELQLRGPQVQNQDRAVIRYKQFFRDQPRRFDLLVDQCLFVEAKAIESQGC